MARFSGKIASGFEQHNAAFSGVLSGGQTGFDIDDTSLNGEVDDTGRKHGSQDTVDMLIDRRLLDLTGGDCSGERVAEESGVGFLIV